MADATKAQITANLKLFQDGVVVFQQPFQMRAVSYTEHATDRLILATNSGWQQVSMGGVAEGKFFSVIVDRPILVSINTTLVPWNVGRGTKGGMIGLLGEYTHVYLRNNSLTNTAIVKVAIADENE